MFPNFIGYFLVPQVRFAAPAGLPEGSRDARGVVGLPLRYVEHHHLNRRKPQRHRPGVMLDQDADEAFHRAIVGSMERFIGILIEHYAGAMPLWLAPVQVVVLNISEGQADYAARVATALRQAGWRCEADLRNEKITYKIREHSLQKLPYQLIVGEKEK